MELKTKTFCLGRTVATPNAPSRLDPADVLNSLARRAACDWGDCGPEDAAQNELALDRPRCLFSVYRDRHGTRFGIITQADRRATTVLLPEDY
jgi:hypothetical protein